MKSEFSWQYNPQADNHNIPARLWVFIFVFISLVLVGWKMPLNAMINFYVVLLFISFPFLFIFVLAIIVKFSASSRFMHHYTINSGDINISCGKKNKNYQWSDIRGWTGSVEEMKSDNSTVPQDYNEPETAIFLMLSKKKDRELIWFPSPYYKTIIEILDQYTRHIPPHEVGKYLD